MAKKSAAKPTVTSSRLKSSALVDTRLIYCGDNLEQLKKLPNACVDLIYIDPPFNSNRNYEVFWPETSERRRFDDRHESTKAYIDYMRPRCAEMSRVLKKTGSFYYHCDWHASHYVKVMLDQIFGENNFQSEIIWKRTSAHSSSKRYGPVHDSIFFYTGSSDYTWNQLYQPYDENYLRENYRNADKDGRKWKSTDLTGDGVRHGDSGKPWRDVDVTIKGRHWAIPDTGADLKGKTTQEKLDELDAKGLIYWPEKEGGIPRYKQYADEMPGIPLQTVWNDIPPIGAHAAERLGYPTQKPLALLERLIKTSSKENDIVLDAFCGCGTALVAAHRLKRQWIGIDISPTACRVMAKRLRDVCGVPENESLWKAGRGFVVRDLPKTEKELRKYPHFEFENWAVVALGGIPNKIKVADMGIDGRIYPVSSSAAPRRKQEGELGLKERWYPIQVKQTDKVGRPDIDSFEAVMMREDCDKGFFVGFSFSSDALTEISRFFVRTGKIIQPLTVREIVEEEIMMKLA
jgi:DNA modification methylase